MYDELNLSVEEIMQQVPEYERAAVLNALARYSPRYRRETQKPGEATQACEVPLITDEEDRELIEGAKLLARCSEDESVRARMIIYLHNEKKGRHDVKAGLGPGATVNILTINNAIKAARSEMAGVKSILQLPGVAGSNKLTFDNCVNGERKARLADQLRAASAVVDIGEDEIHDQ